MAISPYIETLRKKARYKKADSPALIQGERILTWRELSARVDSLAVALKRLGIRKGDKCALLFHNSIEFIEIILAAQAIGAVPVPINYRYVASELLYVLDNSDAVLFLFRESAAEMVAEIRPELKKVRNFVCKGEAVPDWALDYDELIASAPPLDVAIDVRLEDISVIIYTGGTTGNPKGVMLTYGNFDSNQWAIMSFVLSLLPPVPPNPAAPPALTGLQQKTQGIFLDMLGPMKALFENPTFAGKTLVLDLVPGGEIGFSPVTLRPGPGGLCAFAGMPNVYDLKLTIYLGDDLKKFSEISILSSTLKGRIVLSVKTLIDVIAGRMKLEGSMAMKLGVLKARLSSPGVVEEMPMLAVPPLFHLASYSMWQIFWLFQNGPVAIPRTDVFDPAEVFELASRHKVRWLFMVPTMWKRLIDFPGADGYDMSSVRIAFSGAALLQGKYKSRILTLLPSAILLDAFGQTEMAPITTIRADGDPGDIHDRSVGKLLPGLVARITDDTGKPVPDGEVGELWYKGGTIMKGYYRDEDKTRNVIDGEGWFKSGDLARRGADGEIYVVERKTECINSGGEKIYPIEVEEIIAKNEKVDSVCVIGIPDEEWGETVMAVVVAKQGVTVTREEIIDWCRGRLAGFKKPRTVIFAESLPLSPVGKVLRAKIKELYGKPAGASPAV